MTTPPTDPAKVLRCPACGSDQVSECEGKEPDDTDPLMECDHCCESWTEGQVAWLRSQLAAVEAEAAGMRQRIRDMHQYGECTVDNCMLDGGPEHEEYFTTPRTTT